MSEPERYHIIKYGDDEPEHEPYASCWCKPFIHYADIESGVAVYVHRERAELMQ